MSLRTRQIMDLADDMTEEILRQYRNGITLENRTRYGAEANRTLKRLRTELEQLRRHTPTMDGTTHANIKLAQNALDDLHQAIYEKALNLPRAAMTAKAMSDGSIAFEWQGLGKSYRDDKGQLVAIPTKQYVCKHDRPCVNSVGSDMSLETRGVHSYDCWDANVARLEGPNIPTPTESEPDMNIMTTYAKTKAGTVGQILHKDTIVWESAPQQDEKDDKGKVVRNASTVAVDVAEAHVDEVVANLFANGASPDVR